MGGLLNLVDFVYHGHSINEEAAMSSSNEHDDCTTDAMTQSNVKVIGDAPAKVMGNLYQAVSHATGIALENAVYAQQEQNVVNQAATAEGVNQIYTVDTAATGVATVNVDESGALRLLEHVEAHRQEKP